MFKGTSFRLDVNHDSPDTVDFIHSFGAVKKIWPVTLYSKPAKVISTLGNLAGLSVVAPPNRKRTVFDPYSTHVMSGVDKLHDHGFTGEGLFIGVVDTGVDYLHPALGGGFGPGFKVVAGSDLVGGSSYL